MIAWCVRLFVCLPVPAFVVCCCSIGRRFFDNGNWTNPTDSYVPLRSKFMDVCERDSFLNRSSENNQLHCTGQSKPISIIFCTILYNLAWCMGHKKFPVVFAHFIFVYIHCYCERVRACVFSSHRFQSVAICPGVGFCFAVLFFFKVD